MDIHNGGTQRITINLKPTKSDNNKKQQLVKKSKFPVSPKMSLKRLVQILRITNPKEAYLVAHVTGMTYPHKTWITDIGASKHITHHSDWLKQN